jgi:hypothetical protein
MQTGSRPEVDRQLDALTKALSWEREAESRELLEQGARAGMAAQEANGALVRHLVVSSEEGVAGGLLALVLRRGDGSPLPPLRAGPGDPVGLGGPDALAHPSREGSVRGVLQAVGPRELTVVVDREDEEEVPRARLAAWPLSTTVTFDRCQAALAAARSPAHPRTTLLRDVLLGARPATPAARGEEDALPPALAHLNDDQARAVQEALASPEAYLVHGPPGTGKTATAAAVAWAALARGERVLLCAASNAGADELCRALLRLGGDPVRVGHPARVDPALHGALLSERVRAHDRARLADELARQAENLRSRSQETRRRGPGARDHLRERRAEWRAMVADARRYLAQAHDEVLCRARAVACTLSGAGGRELAGQGFDLCVVDEASQATTPLLLIPLAACQRYVLCGDHHQLPPTVLSPEAGRAGLGDTVFDARHRDGAVPGRMLTVQYRMHRALMAFPSTHTYGGRLVAHPRVATRGVEEVVGHAVEASPGFPLAWVDTAGTGFADELPPGSRSWVNPGEADLVARVVRAWLAVGLVPAQVGVVAPYSAQVAALRARLAAEVGQGLEVDSVDAFQGREKEAVVVGLTRSNDEGNTGFVEDRRRLNVAITRARCGLCVVGDSATVGRRGSGEALLGHAQESGAYLSAYSLPGGLEPG